jgi:hypothetical protein
VQVGACVGSIMWTFDCEEVILSNQRAAGQKGGEPPMSMQKLYTKQVTQLTGLIELVREKLNNLQRSTITALVTQDVHYREDKRRILASNDRY